MKKSYIFTLLFSFLSFTHAQTFDGDWSVEYVTPDDGTLLVPNSIGSRTISVAATEENSFVALATHFGTESYYLVGYKNASHESGILGTYEYGPTEKKTKWIDGFSQAFLEGPRDLASLGNIVYVANNDADHNILAFELREDSVYSYPQRYKTGDRDIWAIDIDDAGHVFVTIAGDSTTPGSVLIFDDPNSSGWNSQGSTGTLLHEIVLPDAGTARGITVNNDGSILYVSNFLTRDIYCYIGDPIDGYTQSLGFNFDANTTFDVVDVTLEVGPWGLQYMDSKNLLFVGHDASFTRNEAYNYGRYYIINPNSGEILDTINVAEWNFSKTGVYNTPDTLGTASGYAATYNLDFDENFNIYAAAYYGWSIEKWLYSGELPTIEVTITSVEILNETIPNDISLGQNYPNPFNPSTTIEFELNKEHEVDLAIYNLNGELVTKLVSSSKLNSGIYKVTFDASNLSSGNYFYTLKVGDNVITKKMTLLK